MILSMFLVLTQCLGDAKEERAGEASWRSPDLPDDKELVAAVQGLYHELAPSGSPVTLWIDLQDENETCRYSIDAPLDERDAVREVLWAYTMATGRVFA